MRIRNVLAAVVLASLIIPMSARADGTDCTVAGTSSDSPHLIDTEGDWNGATGTGSGLPVGDVNQKSGDIIAVYFTSDGAAIPKYTAHLVLGSLNDPLNGSEVNEIAYIYFSNPRSKVKDDSGALVSDVFLSASFNGRGTAAFGYGYTAPDPQTGVNSINDKGGATGKYVAGAPGEVQITIPTAMGQPKPGDLIGTPSAETRFLFGAAGNGLLFPEDDTSNADGCVDGVTA